MCHLAELHINIGHIVAHAVGHAFKGDGVAAFLHHIDMLPAFALVLLLEQYLEWQFLAIQRDAVQFLLGGVVYIKIEFVNHTRHEAL